MPVDQVLDRACAGEPTTDQALALRARLRAFGPAEVYAFELDPSVEGDILPVEALPADAVVYVYDGAALPPGRRCVDAGPTRPLVFDAERLQHVEPHAATVFHLDEAVKGPVCVGMVSPRLVEAFHVLTTYLEPDVKLALLGPAPDLRSVQLLVHELNLAGAWLTGPLTDAERAAYYRRATLFVALGGDDLAALDAMAMGVPTVTVPADPRVVAEAVHAVLGDVEVRSRLAADGRRQAQDVAHDEAAAAFVHRLVEQA